MEKSKDVLMEPICILSFPSDNEKKPNNCEEIKQEAMMDPEIPKIWPIQEYFKKIMSSMDNIISILDQYTYDPILMKVNRKVAKKIKVADQEEEGIFV